MRVTISNFGGIIPRRSDHTLPNISATVAHDVKLRNGRIEAWHDPAKYAAAVAGAQTIAIVNCCPLSWNTDVSVADVGGRNTVSYYGDRYFFVTGRLPDGNLEMVRIQEGSCTPRYIDMSLSTLPAPKVNGPREYCDRDYTIRSYMYTLTMIDGSETPPSLVSDMVRAKDGDKVTVSGWPITADVANINIYRGDTGFRDVNGRNIQEPMSAFFHLATVNTNNASFVDGFTMTQLGPPFDLDRTIQRFAPKGLHSVVSLDGQMRLAAATGPMICMSENEQLWNWPVDHDLILDNDIVHMRQMGGKLFVTTTTTPYIIDVPLGEIPVVTDLKYKLPDIGKKRSCGACMTPHGMVYSSWMGLILIRPTGQYEIITAPWFGEDEWREMAPDTVRLGYWEEYLFCCTDTGTFMLNLKSDTYDDLKLGELVTLSDRPIDMFTTNTGQLAMLLQDGIYLWDTGEKLRPYTWTSRELFGGSGSPAASMPSATGALGCTWSPVSAKVRTTGTQFTLTTPIAGHPGYTRPVQNETPFRLPRIGRHMWYKVTFEGTEPVEFFDMGTAHITVNEGI